MSFFGTRRFRATRVFRPSQSLREQIQEGLQDYKIVKQLLIGISAVAVLLLALQSWQTRFPYRVGQYVPDGVLSRVSFQVENVRETQQTRVDAENNAPLVFVQHNEVLTSLTATFGSQLRNIASAESAASLSPSMLYGFNLSSAAPEEFNRLHAILNETDAVGERLDDLQREFSQWCSEIRVAGILGAEALEHIPAADPDERQIEIVNESGQLLHLGVLSDLILEDQLRDTGILGKAWQLHKALEPLRPWVERWMSANLNGQLVYDEGATALRREEAAAEAEARYDFFPADSVLIPAGSYVTPDNWRLLVHEFDAWEVATSAGERLLRITGATILLSALVVLLGIYLARSEPELLSDTGQLTAYVLICAAAVGTGTLLSVDPWRAEIVPVMAGVIVIAIVHNPVLAILTGFCLSVMISFATLERLDHFVTLTILCVTVAMPLKTVSSRSTLIKIGFVAALTGFVCVWGLNLVQAHTGNSVWNSVVLIESLKVAGWSLVCCYVVAGSLPFIERAFGIVTDISLLELTDVSHPLLQELARRAPSTYNHSVSVGTIGEAAADAIGANGLLVRVGAYFHDIGKMLKPEYFIENMTEDQQNHHDKLTPAMSALIIIGHVKDGAELGEQHNLPQNLIDFIEQHHGTTLVEYFFHEAAARADEDHRTDAEESTFRYPGPKPQSRETGVMMLCDAVESASRTLSEPTPKRIQSLVREITLKRLLDGQFDECGLTMAELRVVQESIVKTLLAVHHGRIKYPDQKTA